MLLTPTTLPYHLVNRGHVQLADMVGGKVTFARTWGRHRNWHVVLGNGRGLFVKQARGADAEFVSLLENEARLYVFVSRDAGLGSLELTPRFIDFDSARSVLVLQRLAGAIATSEVASRLAVLVGQQLAEWHRRAAAQLPALADHFPSTLPVAISLEMDGTRFFEDLSTANRGLLALIQDDRNLLSQLHTHREMWEATSLVHGDVKFENCLVIESSESTDFRLIDWELAAIGDPAWDIAGWISSLMQAELFGTAASAATRSRGGTFHAEKSLDSPAVTEFLDAAGCHAASGDRDKVIRFTAARLLQTAFERGFRADEVSRPMLQLFEAAKSLLEKARDTQWQRSRMETPSNNPCVKLPLSSGNLAGQPLGSQPGCDEGAAYLQTVVDAVAIRDKLSFEFAGQPITVPANQTLAEQLMLTLYQQAFARRFYGTAVEIVDCGAAPAFVARLSAANTSQATTEAGWAPFGSNEREEQFTSQGRLQRTAPLTRSPLLWQTADAPRAVLPVQHEARDWMPQFYFAFGEHLPNQADDRDNLRIYFHCTADAAVLLMRWLTSTLNGYQIPFRMKCLNHPRLFDRVDALVLFFEKRYYQCIVRLLGQLPDEVPGGLQEGVPLFSKRLGQGVGLAEDPGNGESFGQSRTRMLAEALVAAWRNGNAAMNAIQDHFASQGIELQTAYLNGGSCDWYSLPPWDTGS